MAEDQKTDGPVTMHINQALALVEQWIASQRNYQAASVVKAAVEYIDACEKKIASLEEKLASIAAVESDKVAAEEAASEEAAGARTVN